MIRYLLIGVPLTAVPVIAAPDLVGDAFAPLLRVAVIALFVGGLTFVWLRAIQRKRAGEIEALRTEQARFRSLTAVSADWFWETDVEDRVSWLAGASSIASLFGESPAVGKRFWETDGIQIAPAALQAHRDAIRLRVPFFDFELRRVAPEGTVAVHVVSGEPRHDAAGRFAGYRGVGRDITVQRQAERALERAKERLDLAVEGAGVAVWDCEIDSDRIYLSEAWAMLLGHPPRAQTVRSLDLLEAVHVDDRSATREAFVDTIRGLRPRYEAEYRLRTQPGGWRWVHGSGRVTARDARGRASRISGTVIDIDARRRAEQALREAEARYRSLVELAPDAIVVHAGDVIEFVNPAALRLFGARSQSDLLGKSVVDFVHPSQINRVRERLAYHAAGPGMTPREDRRMLRLDGSEAQVEAANVSFVERGRLVVQTVMRDVTERRKARDAIAERDQRFRDVIEAAGEYVWEVDLDWRFGYLSGRVEAVLGYSQTELLGRRLQELMPLAENRIHETWFAERVTQPRAFKALSHRVITKAGRVIWQSLSGVPMLDGQGRLRGFRGTAADITSRREAEERLEYLSTRDMLTNLPNRAHLGERIQRAVRDAARKRLKLAVLSIGLDRFHLVNDAYGYAAGDNLLRAVGERLGNTLGRPGVLARLGGDEFALLWEGVRSSTEAVAIARRVQGVLARPFTVEGHTLGVSASIGIGLYAEHGSDAATLLQHAGVALAAAKEAGPGGVRCFEAPQAARALERLQLENDLRTALARDELNLAFQPVVRSASTHDRTLVGAEVLVRWQHPTRGLMGPDSFIPLAEDCGLINGVGEWTLERALSQIAAWRTTHDLWFALNVSAGELSDGDAFVSRLDNALRAHGIEGRQIELEVTERVLVSHWHENVETLRRVGALGVRIAIDDFGTGYSSLSYLRRLPIDKLKIDRAFLRELETSSADRSLVQAIAAMSQSLGVSIAAEGVETLAQLERLVALGCDHWQGHLFSAPLDAHSFEALLRDRKRRAS